MPEQTFKKGLYRKPRSGKIVYVTKGMSEQFNREVWQVFDGRRANSPIIRAFYPKVKDRPQMVLEGDSLGWGPSKYLLKAEYIGKATKQAVKDLSEEAPWLAEIIEGEKDAKKKESAK